MVTRVCNIILMAGTDPHDKQYQMQLLTIIVATLTSSSVIIMIIIVMVIISIHAFLTIVSLILVGARGFCPAGRPRRAHAEVRST